jgi:F-type H+-transporting ATPase subunit b
MKKYSRFALIFLIAAAFALAPVVGASAQDQPRTHEVEQAESIEVEEEAGGWRVVWDTIWRFINFGVLAFIIVYYGKKPLMDFLRKHSRETIEDLNYNKQLLSEAEAEFREAEAKLDDMEKLVKEIETYMREDAERTKNRLIEDAHEKAEMIMKEAHERANTFIEGAKAQIKAELIQMAVEEAEALIREKIDSEDNQRLIQEYISGIASEAEKHD